jgi:hypothetical protein
MDGVNVKGWRTDKAEFGSKMIGGDIQMRKPVVVALLDISPYRQFAFLQI